MTDDTITMKTRATLHVGEPTAGDAMERLNADVVALVKQAAVDPKATFTKENADLAANMIRWHTAQAAQWQKLVRVY